MRRWLRAVVGVVALSLLLAPAASGAGSGSFTPASGSLGTARSGATATLLGSGQVLVAGGATEFATYVGVAELFAPATTSFSPTGSLGTARGFAGAARLPDGKVLIAGGATGIFSNTATAELYDPATNSFSATNPMGTARSGAAVAPLPDGRVLFAGGFTYTGPFTGTTLNTSEIFNPATNTFSSAGIGPMTTPRSSGLAAPLPGGKVLIAGGYDGSSYLASAEIFDPATNTFSSAGVGPLSTRRFDPAGGPLPDGRVLIAGGYDGATDLSSAEVFDPKTQTFSSAGIGSMGTARTGAAGAPLADGRVLIAGGSQGTTSFASAEIYGAANTFSFKLKGRKLRVTVSATGKVEVAQAGLGPRASIAKKGKRKRLLKPASASGGPGTIALTLKLTKRAKKILKTKRKLKVKANVTFSPEGGLANSKTPKLKFKGKKRKKK